MLARLFLVVFLLCPLNHAVAERLRGASEFMDHAVFNGTDGYVWMTENTSSRAEGTVELWLNTSRSQMGQVWGGVGGLPGAKSDRVRLGTHTSTPGFGWAAYSAIWRWTAGPLPPTHAWIHVAATWSASGCVFYVNGEPVATGNYGGGTPSYGFELVGASSWGVSSAMEVDELRIWDHARSQSQIQALMTSPLPSTVYEDAGSGLLAYYSFDAFEDLGVGGDGADDLRDLSVNANHADAEGGVTLGPGIVAVEVPSWSELKTRYGN